MKSPDDNAVDEMREEYEFDYSKGARGKYHHLLLREGANVALLEPDVAEAFRDSAAVNDALRSLLQIIRSTQQLTEKKDKSSASS